MALAAIVCSICLTLDSAKWFKVAWDDFFIMAFITAFVTRSCVLHGTANYIGVSSGTHKMADLHSLLLTSRYGRYLPLTFLALGQGINSILHSSMPHMILMVLKLPRARFTLELPKIRIALFRRATSPSRRHC